VKNVEFMRRYIFSVLFAPCRNLKSLTVILSFHVSH